MSGTLATYGLFRNWYFRTPEGETVYWAIPLGKSINDKPEVLYTTLAQGKSVGNERAVRHAKVEGVINPQPFVVDGRKYSSAFNWTVADYYYGGKQCVWDFSCQIYENGCYTVESFVPHDGTILGHKRIQYRSISFWEFNGSLSCTSSDVTYMQYDDEPERISSRGTSSRQLRAWWTGEVYFVTYNWPLIIAQEMQGDPCPVNFSNLIVEASEEMKYSANNADNVRQFFDVASSLVNVLNGSAPKKVLKRILKGTSNPRAFGHELKELSQSAWLTSRYVIDTTKSDVEDFLDKVGSIDVPIKEGEHIVRAGEAIGNWTCHVKIRSRDRKQNALAETHRWAMTHGFALTPQNLWDMVPFSFMVDWFIPVGETLGIADAEFFFHSAYYEILSYTASRKWKKEVKIAGNKFMLSSYVREVSPSVPIISTLTYDDPSSRTVRNRVIDASAIFL